MEITQQGIKEASQEIVDKLWLTFASAAARENIAEQKAIAFEAIILRHCEAPPHECKVPMVEITSILTKRWRESADLAELHIADEGMEIENETHMRDMRMCADELERVTKSAPSEGHCEAVSPPPANATMCSADIGKFPVITLSHGAPPGIGPGPEAVSPPQEIKMERREGWMDSIDFDYEVGHALGGNVVYPDPEDLKKHKPCLDTDGECTPKRVYIFDAEEFDKSDLASPAGHCEAVSPPREEKLSTYTCECGHSFLVEGKVIGKKLSAEVSPAAPQPTAQLVCPACHCLTKAHHGPKIGCEGAGGNCFCSLTQEQAESLLAVSEAQPTAQPEHQ